MKCVEAAEYVSALCDGFTVPRSAAEHINACSTCREQLKGYLEMGAELRRAASLEMVEAPELKAWPERRKWPAIPGLESWKTIRLPRLALVSLLAAIVVLASGWVLTGARASTTGSVLLLQYALGDKTPGFCALSAVDQKFVMCSDSEVATSGRFLWQLKLLSKDGDQATLGVRSRYIPQGEAPVSINELSQQQFMFTPGQTLRVDVDGLGTIDITGQWIDHIPAIPSGRVGVDQELDPGPGEMRLFSPLLLRENLVIGDFNGGRTTNAGGGWALDIFLKGVGRFIIAPTPLPNAVQAAVDFNRISFTIDGKAYVLVNGAPIMRGRTAWVRYDPNPPAWDSDGGTYFGSEKISKILSGQ